MTSTRSPLTRWLVLAALSAATAVMFAVSLRGNYLFGYGLGQTEEKRHMFAWANVAADIWKTFGLIAISHLWRSQRRRAASVASVAWVLCLVFGINSALGIYAQDRSTLTGTRDAARATYRDIEAELSTIDSQLRALPAHRSVVEIDGVIAQVAGRAVIVGERVRGTVAAVSHNCTKIDARTAAACQELGKLGEERAIAQRSASLTDRARELHDAIRTLRERGSMLPSDPVAEFYAWATGGFLSVRDVGLGFPLLFALLIEVVSAFGPITIAAYAESSRVTPRRATAGRAEVVPAATSSVAPRHPSVIDWMAERTLPGGATQEIDIADLYVDYAQWCTNIGFLSGPISEFEHAFDQARDLPDLVGKVRKLGRRYIGISLTALRERRHG